MLVTKIRSRSVLEILHIDLWGPTSILSMDGYRYYIFFVDDYTRHIWIFPFTHKLEVVDTFKHSKHSMLHVEKYFSLSIETLQSA